MGGGTANGQSEFQPIPVEEALTARPPQPALIKALPTCFGAVSVVSMRVCVVLLLAVAAVALANGSLFSYF